MMGVGCVDVDGNTETINRLSTEMREKLCAASFDSASWPWLRANFPSFLQTNETLDPQCFCKLKLLLGWLDRRGLTPPSFCIRMIHAW